MTHPYLTTSEVAELLRVKERKVYDLAAADEIPHRRVTGKLLFPRDELLSWIEGGETGAPERPPVLAGSHDPLLDWALRESGCGLAALVDGSRAGLRDFAEGRAALAGLHIPEEDGWNLRAVAGAGLRDCVLIGWAARSIGLILGESRAGAATLAGLRGARLALRQQGAGARELFDRLCAEAGLAEADFTIAPALARNESDAAAAVAAGEADAALGVEASARRFKLLFARLAQERFDLLIDRRAYFTPPVQTLLTFARSSDFAAKAAAMGGYDVSEAGAVRWVSP